MLVIGETIAGDIWKPSVLPTISFDKHKSKVCFFFFKYSLISLVTSLIHGLCRKMV